MKTKINAVLVGVAVSFCYGDVWGQHFSNHGSLLGVGPWQKTAPNQPAHQDQFYASLTNLSRLESTFIDYFRGIQKSGSLSRTRQSEQPDNYSQMTEDQKDIFDVLFRAAKQVQELAADAEKRGKNNKEVLLQPKDIPYHPWRKINGKTVYVLSPDSGFSCCVGTVIQSMDGGVLFRPVFNISGDCFIKNFPFQVADGYEMLSKIMALKVGIKQFTTVLGGGRTVTEYDYGEPCERPKGGEEIETAAQAPTPYEQKQLQEIESSLTDKLNAAAAANKRVADFVKKIKDDKIMAVEKAKQRKDLIKETGKSKALKFNQDAADKGDAYGLMRMGERYRDGDGVEKDLAKAKEYFTKAADAGSPTAAEALKKLPTN